MELRPREKDKLLIFTAALLADRRMVRGAKLDYPEAVAYLSAAIREGTRDRRTVAEPMSHGAMLLTRDDAMMLWANSPIWRWAFGAKPAIVLTGGRIAAAMADPDGSIPGRDGATLTLSFEDVRGDGMSATGDIVRTVLGHYPDSQAIYLFGSYGTENEWPDSDVDIALLLPPDQAKASRMLAMSPLCAELGSLLGKDVDLINLRVVSTVFQKEIIAADRRIHTGDAYAADEFEMLVLSFYQKLAEERADILEDFWRTGRAYRA